MVGTFVGTGAAAAGAVVGAAAAGAVVGAAAAGAVVGAAAAGAVVGAGMGVASSAEPHATMKRTPIARKYRGLPVLMKRARNHMAASITYV
jgi:hypothetical protein